ncbi:hypothetical protein ACFPRL_27560 [Pseudoclavibacter helvolus]
MKHGSWRPQHGTPLDKKGASCLQVQRNGAEAGRRDAAACRATRPRRDRSGVGSSGSSSIPAVTTVTSGASGGRGSTPKLTPRMLSTRSVPRSRTRKSWSQVKRR